MLSELSKGRRNNLDLCRLIAAVLVIYSHSFPICVNNYDNELIAKLSRYKISGGSLAVAVFFVLSGFLITKSYDNSRNIGQYLKARVLRIWPALCVVVMISVFVIGPIFTSLSIVEYFKNVETWNYLKNLSLRINHWALPGVFADHFQISTNGSLWTLEYEAVCYLMVAVVGGGIKKRKEYSVGLLLLFCFAYWQREALAAAGIPFLSSYFLQQFSYLGMYFAAGMVYYYYREYIEITWRGAVIALFAFIIGIKYGDVNFAFTFFGTYVVMFLAFNGKIVFDNVSKYGDLSYGIYIWAFPVQQIWIHIFKGAMNPYFNFLLSVMTVVPIAALSWHLVEKRCLNLKNKQLIRIRKQEVGEQREE